MIDGANVPNIKKFTNEPKFEVEFFFDNSALSPSV